MIVGTIVTDYGHASFHSDESSAVLTDLRAVKPLPAHILAAVFYLTICPDTDPTMALFRAELNRQLNPYREAIGHIFPGWELE